MKAEEIFLAAVEMHDQVERAKFLKKACAGDNELHAVVEGLMHSHEAADSFLEAPLFAGTATFESVDPTPIGSQIGPYKLREQIGEGGMGVVYVAEQTKPVKRKVALKIIRPGMASKNVVARFEAERQALAMMDHPNIAKVYDGGATDSGQPYFVMELVQGLPITDYCDQQQLSTVERLKLFAKVCRAVQHAHQKGIIHRDLKPSNIIVSEIDDAPVPKVIDFGVAKAVGHTLTEETVYTHFSQMLGTPLYMSPEQAGLGVVDVDTRSDVYSLGVLLYSLLTGQTPFDSDTLKQAGFDEMRRIIREDEPLKPSAVVSTLNAEALSTISQRRNSDPRKLSDSLNGELDWLVMKSLEKDRNRRYESPSSLADDIERYLRGDAVIACPPSTAYRVRKLAERNKAALATVAAMLATLLIGIVGTSWQAWRATRNLQLANQQREQAEANLQLAMDAMIVEPVATRVWMNWDREKILTGPLRKQRQLVFDVLTRAIQSQPQNAAQWNRRAAAYLTFGEYEKAVADHSQAIQLEDNNAEYYYARATTHREFEAWEECIADLSQANDLEPNQYLRARGRAYLESGQYAKAIADLTKSIEPGTVGGSHQLRGWAYQRLGKYQLALADMENVAAHGADNDREQAYANHDLAWFLVTCPDRAVRNPVRAVELARKSVRLVPQERDYWNTLGVALYRIGEFEESVAALSKASDLGIGGDDKFSVPNLCFRAMAHWNLGAKDLALSLLDRAAARAQGQPDSEQARVFIAEANALVNEVDAMDEPGNPDDVESSPEVDPGEEAQPDERTIPEDLEIQSQTTGQE